MKTAAFCWLVARVLLEPRSIAQAQFEWLATHDGVQAHLPDHGIDGVVDSSGNVFMVSSVRLSAAVNDTNVDLNKYSSLGVLLWTRRFDVLSSAEDNATDIALAPNGDVCIVGGGSAPNYDLFLLRYDTNGNLPWNLSFGGAAGAGGDSGQAVGFDLAGNIVVAGGVTDASGQQDMLVKAFTPAGAPLWETRVDGPQHGGDFARAMCIDATGAIFVAGYVDYSGAHESGVAKLDAQGQFQWLTRWNASYPLNQPDEFWGLATDGQGGVVAVGNAVSQALTQSYYNGSAARIGGSGSLLWANTYGGTEYTYAIDATVDAQGVVNILYFNDFLATYKTVVKRFTGSGQLLSTSSYDGLAHHGAYPGSFVRGAAGQIYVAGNEISLLGSASDQAFLMQQDSTGATNWIRRFPGNGFGVSIGPALAAPANRIVLVGSTVATTWDSDALVMQIDVSVAPGTYCTAKVNSQFCVPSIGGTGAASLTSPSAFDVAATSILNNRVGLLFYGPNGRASYPFQDGYMCVQGPTQRTPVQASNGTAPPIVDCSGSYAFDFNAWMQAGNAPNILAGTQVNAQYWYRDPQSSSTTGLTNGLEFYVHP